VPITGTAFGKLLVVCYFATWVI